MKIVAYIRVRDTYLMPVWKQLESLPKGEVVKRFDESEPCDDRPELAKAIACAKAHSCTLAVPAMFQDEKTLRLLQDAEITVRPSVTAALNRCAKRNQRLKEGMQGAKDRGAKFGANRPDFDPSWRKPGKAAKASGRKRKAEAMEFYAPLVPEMVKLRDKGLSYAKIAEKLNDSGHRTSTGSVFRPNMVIRVLDREGKFDPVT